MEEQLKEIEGLLETTTDTVNSTPQHRIKKYIKLVFPHVALVAVVCLYAVIGAYIFYRLESPNEDRLKAIGKNNIGDMRMRMLDLVKRRDQSKRVWKDSIEEELYRFNDKIYKAFKEQYVRYPDVRVSNLHLDADKDDPDRTKRHRNTKSRADRGEKMWTASSALFFAATTMATIGYGNIVPATSSGRIACVVFALFGAPLAIITIGDLGKFLSECTIWLYKQMKKAKIVIRTRWKRLRGSAKEDCEDQSDKSSTSTLDWEELVMDKTEVPVLMVFTILLLYIAFGGVLFSFLEGWSYMDAFYYSFISLTTIGFGDIVPENHDYIVLMLMYLGIGLAVTTMCIDLVGIQYIQKIHYFGRKFRGTDLLHLLKRKRMIERRLAMGQGEEILQMYMQQMQQHIPETPIVDETFEEKCPSPEWAIDDSIIRSRCSITLPHSEKVPSPNVLSIRSFRTPSLYSNSSASGRSMMYNRYGSRGASWDESGPSLSEHCSLSTEPSVYARQAYWDNYQSPDPSVTSFEYEFPLPSPDYAEIAAEVRRSRRLLSCPAAHFACPPSSPIGLACMEDWDSYIQMLEEYEKPYERGQAIVEIRPTELRIETLPLLFGLSPVTTPTYLLSPPKDFAPSPMPSESCAMSTTTSPMEAIYHLPQSPPSIFSAEVTSSVQRMAPYISSPPRAVSPAAVSLHSPATLVHPPPEVPSIFLELEVEDQLHMEVHEDELLTTRRNSHVADLPSEEESTSGFDLDLGAFELVDSGLSAETLLNTEDPVIFHQDMPVHSVHHDTVQTEAALANLMSAPSSMLTGAIPPTMVEDNYCFVVDGERVRMGDILGDDQWWRHTSRPTKYFYSEDLRQFHRVNCITAKGKVITAKLASGTLQVNHPIASSSSTPRSSVSGTSTKPSQTNKVSLTHVYKVIRFYSFWKTCTSFHRIVTMIDKVSTDDRNTNPAFKKRLFVQYLWRNAKAVEKARVQKEFDPRRQRLLRFVTDSAQRKRFVEDDTCMFAVILDESENMMRRGKLQRFMTIDSSSRDESEDSIIDFPVEVNACPIKLCKSVLTTSDSVEEERNILYHYGNSCEPIPVFSVDEKPLDGPSTLTNTLRCPVKYISKIPPSMVVDNFCFICDGDEVSEDEILSDQQWWKQTSCSTRFYSSENMTTFHQVTLLTCRGEMRGAYRSRARGAGITSVSLNQVFRVSRHFSSWRTCTSFHRIVSVISPITEEGENSNRFKKRIFVQYFWRQEKPNDRETVTREYLEFKMKSSPRHSLIPPSTSLTTRSWSSRSHYPGLNPYNSTASTSSLTSHDSLSPRAQSRWNILGKALKFSRPRMKSSAGIPSASSSSQSPNSSSINNNNNPAASITKRYSVDDTLRRHNQTDS